MDKLILQVSGALVLVTLLSLAPATHAQSPDRQELKQRIKNQNQKIKEINEEINQYKSELNSTQNRKNTLENVVQSLNSSISKLTERINKTENKIAQTQKQIQSLRAEINQAEQNLSRTEKSLSDALRAIRMLDSQSLIETFLSAESLSKAWRTSDQLAQIQAGLQTRLDKIQSLKKQLEQKRQQAKSKQSQLKNLRSQLASQQTIIRKQKERKRSLLNKTSQQVKEYRKLLAEKRAQKKQFERQLQAFEEQLETTVSDAEVPKANEVAFQWPVPTIQITQRFGGTAFAKRNPSAYGRPFHNGTDFGVPVGTPVEAVQPGTVRAVGNTDAISGCYSYGKWILIDHNSGLSTLYAHLSKIAVQPNESVDSNTVIGYSGNTGYSTGPHLHLTTYIKDDVKIKRLGKIKEQTNCGPAEIPVAPQAGYLNPMKYLP